MSPFEFSKSTDLTFLTVKGTSEEIFEQTDYRNSGGFTNYEKVIIEKGITRLGNSVFSQSTNLKSVEFPSTLISIGENIFFEDTKLEEIDLPEGLVSIPKGTFRNCGIKRLSIPSTVTKIDGGSTFSNPLEKITFPNGNPVYSTNEEGSILIYNKTLLFQACGGCSTITVPAQIEKIGYRFSYYRSNKIIEFEPNSNLKTIEDKAFEHTEITKVVFPHGLETIEGPCFVDSSIVSVFLPSTLVSVPDNLFELASKLTEVNAENSSAIFVDPSGTILNIKKTAVMFIPRTTTSFNIPQELESFDPVFIRTNPSFTTITADVNNDNFYAEDNLLYKKSDSNKYDLIFLGPAGSKTNIKIHANCTSIEQYALSQTLAEYISFLGDKVTKIPNYCFYKSYSIKEIELSESIKEIGYHSIAYNTAYSVKIGTKLQKIGEYGFSRSEIRVADFSGCNKLTQISDRCFKSCIKLTEVRLPPNLTYISLLMFNKCVELDIISIDTSKITQIADNAFTSCKLTHLTFTDTSKEAKLKTIGTNTFSECKFESIRVPDSVTSIGVEGLAYCTNLINLTFGEESELTKIPGMMIAGSNKIVKIFIGPKVSEIEEGVFTESYGLIDIETSVNNLIYDSSDGIIYSKDGSVIWACAGGRTKTTIGPNVETIKSSAFLYCKKLVNISFDARGKLNSIGASTFFGCTSIGRVEFPSNLETIGTKSFSGCESLRDVVFGSGSKLKHIEESAFAGCTSMEVLTIPPTVEDIAANAFAECLGLREVLLCITKSRSGFSKYAFIGCDRLVSISVSIAFNELSVLGKPASMVLDKDCMLATRLFTIHSGERQAAWILFGELCSAENSEE